MYDPFIFTNGSKCKKFGCCAMLLCFITALGVSSTMKPHLHPLSLPEYLELPSEARITLNATSTSYNNALKRNKMHAICRNSNYCEIEGDIRIEANSSTIFVASESISNSTITTWSIEPYPRKGTSLVKSWTLTLQHQHQDQVIPKCTQNHSLPAILFSVGGFSGNFFHAFADLLFPLYLTSFQFDQQVHFLATDYNPWWITKFRHILNKLTRHTIMDIDKETSQVHCYNNIQIGLKFHKELISTSSFMPSMHNFRMLLRQAYSLQRENIVKKGRPRLMIISRQRTRVMTNEHQVSRVARKKGYEVVVAETGNLSRFAQSVNSCDVLMGVHGAGLTNMLFLPDNAVLIQVIPFGGIDGFARLDFENPATGMGIRYLKYKIGVKESSLTKEYSRDHPILRDPKSYMKWDQVWSIYLNRQNVTVDLRRVKVVLAKALKLLRH